MKQEFHITWEFPDYADEPQCQLYTCDMTDCWKDRLHRGIVEVEIGEAPTRPDFTPAKIAEYNKQIANHQFAINNLQGKIQSLLCIEHKPELRPTDASTKYDQYGDDDIPF